MQVKSIAELEHFAILSTCIKLPPVFKTILLSGCLRQVSLYIGFRGIYNSHVFEKQKIEVKTD